MFTVSGFVSLALEVVWFRVLTLFLRPTVYGFAVMLATILAGIALGQLSPHAVPGSAAPVDRDARGPRVRGGPRVGAVVLAARRTADAERPPDADACRT